MKPKPSSAPRSCALPTPTTPLARRPRRLATGLLVLASLALSCVGTADAQVNIERIRKLSAQGFSGSVSGDVEYKSGNAELFEVGGTGRVDYQAGRTLVFFVGSLRYGERRDETFKNSAFVHLRLTQRLRPHLAVEAFTQAERDGFTLLQLRLLGGGGLRVPYVQRDGVGLIQGSGLMVEHENLQRDRVEVHPAVLTSVRWTNYLNLRLQLSESVAFNTTAYIQPRLDRFEDVRVLHDATLAIQLTERLSLTTSFNLRYDSRPPDDIASTDASLRQGLQVSF